MSAIAAALTPTHHLVREVRLYGDLGRLFGRVHHLAVGSAREACQALAAVVPGFERYMLQNSDRGFHVFVGDYGTRDINADQVDEPVAAAEPICIVQAIAGAKKEGGWQVIVGVILMVVAAYFTGGASLAAGGGFWGAVSGLGMSLALGGVVQLLGPSKQGNAAARDDASRNFSDAAANSPQGLPVPLTIGRCWVRGIAVSSGLVTTDIAAPPPPPAINPNTLPNGDPVNPLVDGEFGPGAEGGGDSVSPGDNGNGGDAP